MHRKSADPPGITAPLPASGGTGTDPVRRRLLVLALGGALVAPQARALEVSGFEFADAITVDGRPLVLNGVGLRSVFIMKVFLGALYVPERSRDPATLRGQSGPRRLQMRMLVDMTPERIFKSLESGDRHAPVVPGFEEAIAAVGPVRKGGALDMDLIDGRLRFTVNGLARGAIHEGDQAFQSIMKAWLGERPLDRELKLGLLGQTAPGQ